jgi:DNA invertase Pin-like site-specific DNA recombinase
MGKMFFNILATFAEFEVDLLRTREGMAVARAKGRLKGRQPEAVGQAARRAAPHAQNRQLHDHDLAELFRVSRPTVYRTLAAAEHVAAQGN